jgi:hypothetical protein
MWVPAGPAVKEGYAKGSSAPVHRSKSMFLAYHLRAQQLIFDLEAPRIGHGCRQGRPSQR